MEDEVKPEEETRRITAGFPFGMVMAGHMLKGALFALLNGPLIVLFLKDDHAANAGELYRKAYSVALRETSAFNSGFVSVSILLVVSLVIGILANPFDRLLAVFVPRLLSAGLNALRLGNRAVFFRPDKYGTAEYANFLGSLMRHHTAKSHWEWELFLYELYWSVAMSVVTFAGLSLYLLRAIVGPIGIAGYLVLASAFIAFALTKSISMNHVHTIYAEKVKRDPTWRM
jgi:NhaP-type Na+/H+ and K+/H+ antiporter